MELINIQELQKVDIRVGKVVRAEDLAEARKPTLKLWVDFGSQLGTKQCGAQIAKFYPKEKMEGRYLICVTNLPPRKIAGFESQVMLLAVDLGEGDLSLLQPDRDVPSGRPVL